MPGVTEPVKVVVFTNKGREKNERAPDYVIYRSEEASQEKTNVEQVAKQAAEEVNPLRAMKISLKNYFNYGKTILA